MIIKKIVNCIPWVVVGQIIGVTMIIPLGYFIIDKLKYEEKYNNNAELFYQLYINNSIVIADTMPAYESDKYVRIPSKYLNNVEYVVNNISFPTSSKSDGISNTLIAKTILFYSSIYKRYFILMLFDYYNGDDIFNKEVYLTVNKDDMKNQKYGTKENPIPVLKMVGIHESIRPNNKDFDTIYMNKFYKNNVIRYLKYKMSRKEFNKRFM